MTRRCYQDPHLRGHFETAAARGSGSQVSPFRLPARPISTHDLRDMTKPLRRQLRFPSLPPHATTVPLRLRWTAAVTLAFAAGLTAMPTRALAQIQSGSEAATVR